MRNATTLRAVGVLDGYPSLGLSTVSLSTALGGDIALSGGNIALSGGSVALSGGGIAVNENLSKIYILILYSEMIRRDSEMVMRADVKDKTHISLALQGQGINIRREDVVVGGIYPCNGRNTMTVHGFTSHDGPWNNCSHARGNDCVIYFEQRGDEKAAGTYHVNDEYLDIELSLKVLQFKRYSSVIDIGGLYGPLTFRVRSSTCVDFYRGSERRGLIWSELDDQNRTLPYPHRVSKNPLVVDAVQICGFENMTEVDRTPSQGSDAGYIAKVMIYKITRGGDDDRFDLSFQFRADSIDDVVTNLYSAGQGIQTALSAVTPDFPDGRVSGLVDNLREQINAKQQETQQ